MYTAEFSDRFLKGIRRVDPANRRIVAEWINANLLENDEPRQFGKALKGTLSGFWKYRVGQFRIIAKIDGDKIILLLLDVDHRKDVYR